MLASVFSSSASGQNSQKSSRAPTPLPKTPQPSSSLSPHHSAVKLDSATEAWLSDQWQSLQSFLGTSSLSDQQRQQVTNFLLYQRQKTVHDQRRLLDLQDELRTLRSQVQHYYLHESATEGDLKRTVAQLQQELDTSHEEVGRLSAEVADARESGMLLRMEVQRLKSLLDTTDQQYRDSNQQRAALQGKLVILQHDLSVMQAQLRDTQQSNRCMQHQLDHYEQQLPPSELVMESVEL